MARRRSAGTQERARGSPALPDIMSRDGPGQRSGISGKDMAVMIDLRTGAAVSPSALMVGRELLWPRNVRTHVLRGAISTCRATSRTRGERRHHVGNASSNRSASEARSGCAVALPAVTSAVRTADNQSHMEFSKAAIKLKNTTHQNTGKEANVEQKSSARPPIARRKPNDLTAPRLPRLVDVLLSQAVQVPAPEETAHIPIRFSDEEVADIFARHVPGVRNFLFRDQPGQYSLKFIQSAYRNGLAAFQGTELHEHLARLLRLIVHHGANNERNASTHLREVAEAFMDCQAVQARTIERVGLSIQGVVADFRGLVMRLVGEYKIMAVKMLAAERILKLRLPEDANPVHYESRLTVDLGPQLGLNANDIRRASLDQHAKQRFKSMSENEKAEVAARCRELFDVQALVQAFAMEINSFNEESAPNSLPWLFLDWASKRLTAKHIVFDEETCTRVDVGNSLALAILEDLFLGQTYGNSEMYRGQQISTLFSQA